jgi:hypothetical protein
MTQFTPIQTRQKLVTSLIVSQFLYCDVLFSKSSARLRERLKLAFNSCASIIYGISRYAHISIIDLNQQNLGRSIEHELQHEDMLHDQQDNQEWWTPVSV